LGRPETSSSSSQEFVVLAMAIRPAVGDLT
jgi:hypothetical protein